MKRLIGFALLAIAAIQLHSQTNVVGSPILTQWNAPGVKTSNGAAFLANQTRLFDFVLPGSLTAAKLDYSVTTLDNTATTYDLGIYSNTGALICHLGAIAGTTFSPSTGVKTLTFIQPCVLNGGARYLFAMTASTATASLASTGNALLGQPGATPSSGNATTGGALNASITPAADAPGDTNGFPEFRLHN